ncbi:MAG: hypothetical protein R3190_16270 [Thermoanaerobaculia bacterium]|nr:hypothetical protein [Thermoanaerobaculia bacterium]
MTTRASRTTIVLLTALLAAGAAWPSKQLGPPSQFLLQQENKVAAVKALETTDDGLARFERLAALHGETAETLTVRMPAEVLERVEVGKSYVLGYTELLRDRRTHIYGPDPRGPRILGIPAVGEALLDDSPSMRALTTARAEGEELSDRARLDAVLAQLGREDVQARRFVLAELVLWPGLTDLVGEEDREVLARTVSEGNLEPMAHDYLLRAAKPKAKSWGSEWLAEDCRRLLTAYGTELDLLSPVPSLLVIALETLAVTGEPRDLDLAAQHVASNNPGVGRAAFKAMVALNPEEARERADGLLEGDDLHADTRRELLRYLEAGAAAPGAS